ncbi:MAG TPA: hypothetical protein VF432_27240 [Thermoanaerobaculia bacterium]
MTLRTWILLTVVAVFALPAFAQRYYQDEVITGETGGGWSGEISYATGQYLDNPCTAVVDWVWVSYGVDLYQEGQALATGNQRVLFDEQTSMSGAYSTAGASQSDVEYMPQPYTLRKYHKVNTYDNFHVVTVIDFDPATRQSTVSLETACGNGMPDSSQ